MTNNTPLVAVVDIGKSNSKLIVVNANTSEVVWSASQSNIPLASKPFRQLDIAGIERWLFTALAEVPERHRIQTIVPIAHGATAILLDCSGAPLVAPDYEDPEFNSIATEYRARRDPFANTFSPELGQGLNLGRQLYYLQCRSPELFARVHHIVLYPQYWAFRLCGVLSSEITSLGCHTDLWDFRAHHFANLALLSNWSVKFPALRRASDTLGTIHTELSNRLGLDANCRVLCGLHDSNASFLCHLIKRPKHESFAVISSGTWTVIMARGIDLQRLRPDADMLANIDVEGSPVGTARFMGGREYEAIVGAANANVPPTLDGLRAIITNKTLAMPCFSGVGGPFGAYAGRILNEHGLTTAERASLATVYVALMSELLVESLDVNGDILIDGPLAANRLYGQLLAALRPQQAVRTTVSGPVTAALYLAGFKVKTTTSEPLATLPIPELHSYRDAWRSALPL